MNRFLDLTELDDPTLERLLARARELERQPVRDVLRGRVLGLLFMNPSVRTLASFQAGMAQLGGSCFVITPGSGSWGFEVRDGVTMDQDGGAAEHIREGIPVLAQYADALGVRCFAAGRDLEEDLREPVLSAVADLAPCPLINMESAFDHPCQALGDWKTLDDLEIPCQGGRFVLSWAWHPRPLPMAVPAAALKMAARRGMEVTVLRPEGYALPAPVMAAAEAAASAAGGSVRETADRNEALGGAHVLYAKSWRSPASYGKPVDEARPPERYRDWCVAEDWFAPAEPGAVFMHCLPVRRNVVVRDEVLDGPRSRVVPQAANRLHVQKSVLLEMLAP